jgi:glycosyltransferase 2 family protein
LKDKIISIFKIALPVLIGVYLTWFFFSKLTPPEKEKLYAVVFEANYGWIAVAAIIAVLTHLSRAYRWKFLLEPMGVQPRLSTMYHSVMVGYVLNLTIPRSGELARAAYLARYDGAKTDKVFGTIIVERIIDLIMLTLISFLALYLQKDQQTFEQLTTTEGSSFPNWVKWALLIAGIVGALIFIFIKAVRYKIIDVAKGLIEGVLTISKLKKKTAYIAHTLFIWLGYIAMFWVSAFALKETTDISVNAVFACFIAGSIAISATPGGIGLYPIMVSAVLIKMYGFDSEVAKSFSMLMWAAQTILVVLLGIISLFAFQRITPKTKSVE